LLDMHRQRAEQLRELGKLNTTRTIMRKMATIDNQKELTMAIASGKILRVSNVLAAGYRNGAGTKGLIQLCGRAANGEYKPMNDAREKSLAVAMWRVGGGRLAEIGHRALGLPGLSTLRHNTVIRPLLPSAGRPRVDEIEYNIDACLDALPEEPEARPQILHQCLIMDEVATEKRVRHDDRTNKVVGVCRPHGYLLPLDLQTEKDLETLCDGLREEKAHIAGEVCSFFHGGASLSLTR
jgi:hypothetical protein